MIRFLEDGRTFLHYGPIQMVIDLSRHGKRQQEITHEVVANVIEEFDKLLYFMPAIKGHHKNPAIIDSYPRALQKMIMAVEESEDESLTPLAAVAGALADIALEKAIAQGATRVIINNGGDIALRDVEGKPFHVAIPLNKNSSERCVMLTIGDDPNIGGICTSGVGGRSFTKGIATAAVALARNASLADACATYLGNETNVEDLNIIRCLAEDIDSETDIPGHQVTLKVGPLSRHKTYQALSKGLKAAEELRNKKILQGAVLCIGSDIVTVPDHIASIRG